MRQARRDRFMGAPSWESPNRGSASLMIGFDILRVTELANMNALNGRDPQPKVSESSGWHRASSGYIGKNLGKASDPKAVTMSDTENESFVIGRAAEAFRHLFDAWSPDGDRLALDAPQRAIGPA